jgi:hypothetical protein
MLALFFSLKLDKKIINFIASSFFLAFGFLVLQKAIFFCVAILGLQIYFYTIKKINLPDIFYYWALFFIWLSPYYIYLYINGWFDNYFILNWQLNQKWIVKPALQSQFFNSHWLILKSFFKKNLLLILIFIYSLFNISKYKKEKILPAIFSIYFMFVILFFFTPAEARASPVALTPRSQATTVRQTRPRRPFGRTVRRLAH